jgi:hypothetical protein
MELHVLAMWQQAQLTTDKMVFSLSGKKRCLHRWAMLQKLQKIAKKPVHKFLLKSSCHITFSDGLFDMFGTADGRLDQLEVSCIQN